MRRGIHILLIFILCCACVKGQQESKTAQSLKAAGYVNIHDLDSTIQVDLMYSRADNFTGKVLYTDFKEAYLHPKAAKALVVAQQLLKAERPGELESLLWYMPKNGLTDAIVTSETVTMIKEMDNVVLHFMPVACYTYTIARNTLANTRFLYGL